MRLTAEDILSAVPDGSTVTLQFDTTGQLLAWYVRPPDAAVRVKFGGSGPSRHRGTS